MRSEVDELHEFVRPAGQVTKNRPEVSRHVDRAESRELALESVVVETGVERVRPENVDLGDRFRPYRLWDFGETLRKALLEAYLHAATPFRNATASSPSNGP